MTLWDRVERWRTFADTDYTKGQKLSDARKQGQYELMMSGQSIAYATAAKELEADLRELGEIVATIPHTGSPVHTIEECSKTCPRCALEARIAKP